jgi:hypothetical protein
MSKRKFNQLSSIEKLRIKQMLLESENMEDFLLILNDCFDMKNNIAGSITKNMISSQMINVVLPMLNPYEK